MIPIPPSLLIHEPMSVPIDISPEVVVILGGVVPIGTLAIIVGYYFLKYRRMRDVCQND